MCGKKKKHGRETETKKKEKKGENYDSVLNGGRSIVRTNYKVQSTKYQHNTKPKKRKKSLTLKKKTSQPGTNFAVMLYVRWVVKVTLIAPQ